MKRPSGPDSPKWKGGRTVTNGYACVLMHDHPRAHPRGYVYEHILVAERALGHHLPPGAQVHHVDENTQNNAPSNLVICENELYHRVLHRRQDALDACGNPNWLKCHWCKRYDDPANLVTGGRRSDGGLRSPYHQSCNSTYYRERARRIRESAA